MIVAHIAGMPVEETLGMLAPAALAVIGVSTAYVRSVLGGRRRSNEDDA